MIVVIHTKQLMDSATLHTSSMVIVGPIGSESSSCAMRSVMGWERAFQLL